MSSGSIFDQIPAGQPPRGVTPNFVNPTTQRPQIVVLAAVFTSLATILTLVRCYVRSFLTRSLGWDDYLCTISVAVSWIHGVLLINATRYGYGSHIWDIRASTLLQESNVRWVSGSAIAYPVAVTLVKVSILLLYYRIFQVSKRLRVSLVSSIIFISLIYACFFALTVVTTVKCVSLAALVDYPICRNTYPIALSNSVFNVVTDFWILLLPIPSILGLHLDKQRKIGLLAIFGTGAIACVLSLARCIYLGLTFKLADTFWTAALSSELTIAELNIAIMVACAPALPKFYTTAKAFSSSIYHSLVERTSGLGPLLKRHRATSLNSDEDSRTYEISTLRQVERGHFTTQVTNDTKNTTVSSRTVL